MKNLSDYQKIMQVIDAKGIKIQEAEFMCGLGVTTLQKLKTRNEGKGKLHKDNLEKFLRTFHVERTWWETGEGDMFETGESSSEPIMTMPLDVWRQLQKNFDSFDRNSAAFEKVMQKDQSEKADLLRILINMTSGRIESNKIK